MEEKLFLIDTNSLIHRSFHALPELTTPDGSPAGALYGVASIMLKIIKEMRPTYIAAFFDRPEPTFRDALYAEYKAHRPPTSDILIPQIKETPNLLHAFGIKTFSAAGFEADDLIGTFVERFKKTPDLNIVIISGDQDLLQLIHGNTVCVQYMKKGISEFVLYTEDKVREIFHFSPRQMPDYKGLVGDAADNIPGVRGIGPKTAQDLLREYGSIEEVIRQSERLLPAIQKKIKGHEHDATLSKNLATIHRMAPLPPIRLADLFVPSLNPDVLVPYFERLGFASLVKRIYTTTNTLL